MCMCVVCRVEGEGWSLQAPSVTPLLSPARPDCAELTLAKEFALGCPGAGGSAGSEVRE